MPALTPGAFGHGGPITPSGGRSGHGGSRSGAVRPRWPRPSPPGAVPGHGGRLASRLRWAERPPEAELGLGRSAKAGWPERPPEGVVGPPWPERPPEGVIAYATMPGMGVGAFGSTSPEGIPNQLSERVA